MLTICQQCKKSFNIRPCRLRNGKGKYCSKICYSNYQKNKIEETCIMCQIIFERAPWYGIGKYCSQKCYQKQRENNQEYYCFTCNKKIIQKASAFINKQTKKLSKKHYCNHICYIRNKDANPNWRGYGDGANAAIRRWAKRNPDKVVDKNHRRRVAHNQHPITSEVYADLIKCSKQKCIYCDKKLIFGGVRGKHDTSTIEHIRPILRNGTNHRNNLRMSCWECNMQKGSKLLMEWY